MFLTSKHLIFICQTHFLSNVLILLFQLSFLKNNDFKDHSIVYACYSLFFQEQEENKSATSWPEYYIDQLNSMAAVSNNINYNK